MTMTKIQEYRKIIEDKKTELNLLKQQIEEKQSSVNEKKLYSEKLVKARWVLSEVTRQTQNNFKTYVENMVTLGINSVFQDRDFKFLVDFEIKRGKSECLLRVQEKNEEPYFPKDEMGGSIIDVISFILRIVLWSLKSEKTRNTLIFDEPFRCTGELSSFAGEIIKIVNKELCLQIIMITHDRNLADIGDKTYLVTHNGRFSDVYQG